ncbi:hypothetical protein GQ43DRAFT_281382 [Delitschia confertaspora ATCC 74209]|uniref:Uncharacterized protein n=1 Tax=Delitschia confertaspora ATCC 74209 TaxID=1513339 RepID=A0A9P4JAN5_9PLEO|nr:hypothetical protein GQ43DRAFT_281382 [Delitschia confertaspora ATCC 74209]
MKRVDSALDEQYYHNTKVATESFSTENTDMSCPGHIVFTDRIPAAGTTNQVTGTDYQRPTLGKKACSYPQTQKPSPTQSRRQSVTSSEQSSTQRRKTHTGSKLSSRKAATMIDPSRPTRHYRVRSSQTVPTASRDVDDVLALHFRSCSIFQNSAYSSAPHPSITGTGTASLAPQPGLDPATNSMQHAASPTEESTNTVELPNTVIHWTSPTTRRREYEKIDRSNSGMRCLIRRITPKCVSGPPPPRFYEEDKDDAGSVRRYRMDLAESEDEEEEPDEKSTSSLRPIDQGKRKSTNKNEEERKWFCF